MSFTVKIKDTDDTFEVDEFETVLEAALRQGINFPYSCQSGTCSSCKGKVIEGSLDFNGQSISGTNADKDVLFCCAYPSSDLTIIVEGEDESLSPPGDYSATVSAHQALSPYIDKIMLRPTNRFCYQAGQYIELKIADKTYPLSLANAASNEMELHIQHWGEPSATHPLLHPLYMGAKIEFFGPKGEAFVRTDSPRPIILVAGGSGFAPIKAMIEALMSAGNKRPIHLYWGVRKSEHFYLQDKLNLWTKLIPNFHYIPVVSEPSSDWQGRCGLVHQAVLEDFSDLSAFEVYLAGPFAMSYTARADFTARGLSIEHIHSDAFAFE